MKLKYYLRGMGIGIILTAIVMGFALGGRKSTISDAEVIQRAKALGMVDAGSGVLAQASEEGKQTNEKESTSSDSSADKKGKAVFEEIDQKVADSDVSDSQVSKENESGHDIDKNDNADNAASEQKTSEKNEAKIDSVDTNEISSNKKAEVKEKTDSASDDSTAKASAGSDSDTANVKSSEGSNEVATDTKVAEATKNQNSDSTAKEKSEEAATAASSVETEPAVPSKTVTIPGGMSSDQVAQILYNQGLVDNAVTFNRYLIDTGKDRIIRSGVKTIPEGASYEQIAAVITKG